MGGQGIPEVIGVAGAGTMGSGIAQLAAAAGAQTLLLDPDAEAREQGLERIAAGFDRLLEKGRIDAAAAAEAKARVEPVAEPSALAGAGLIIEAAPERLELKRELLRSLADAAGPECVLATNTSSLSVTELAAAVPHPDRVVGMHFFNPAPVMRLVEIVAGAASSERALAVARASAEAMGKHAIDAADVPGFLVNRCNRPFSLESLKLAEEAIAEPAQIDRIMRMAGRFRMGPFELMDLIGIDVNHAVAEAFIRQSFGEPRYRPSQLAARKVAAGTLGRKSGRGWFSYEDGKESHRPDDPEPPAAGGGDGRTLLIRGELPAADWLRVAAAQAGFSLAEADPWLVIDFGRDLEPFPGAPRLCHLHDSSLHAVDPSAAGFHLLPPLDDATAVEITATGRTDPLALDRTRALFASLGRVAEEVGDAPGLVLGRIVAQLVNESSFLIGEGHGTPADVDAGLELGLNHPRGPVAWSDAIGIGHLVAVLDALRAELGEERYRVAPLLRRRLATGARLSE